MAADESSILQGLNLGTSRDILQNRGSSPLSQLLVELSEDVVERLKDALRQRDINTTALGLSQSIGITEVTVDAGSVTIGIAADYYWKYVNYGVNGTEVDHGAPHWGPGPPSEKSFHDAIRDWIPERGLQLPSEFSGLRDPYESFTFAIMTNIKKHGKKARPFVQDVVNDQLVSILQGPIERLMGQAILIQIVEPWQ